jgi:hypothetical protein
MKVSTLDGGTLEVTGAPEPSVSSWELQPDDPILVRCVAAMKTQDRVVSLWGQLYVVDDIEIKQPLGEDTVFVVNLTAIERGDRPLNIGILVL